MARTIRESLPFPSIWLIHLENLLVQHRSFSGLGPRIEEAYIAIRTDATPGSLP
jgi:hypothetical protein